MQHVGLLRKHPTILGFLSTILLSLALSPIANYASAQTATLIYLGQTSVAKLLNLATLIGPLAA
jgi:hypothetical protein